MIETDWLNGFDPKSMLRFVRGKVSERKLRLFACAWCRASCPHLAVAGPSTRRIDGRATTSWAVAAAESTEASRHALAVAERFADGLATGEALQQAHRAAAGWADAWSTQDLGYYYDAATAAAAAGPADAEDAFLPPPAPYLAGKAGQAAHTADRAQQAVLLREIVGNPFQPKTVDRSWLQWQDGAMAKLAETIYQQHRFSKLPRLAKLLESAGCADAEILAHCRKRPDRWLGSWGIRRALAFLMGRPLPQFQHVRGCWVVDLLTGRAAA